MLTPNLETARILLRPLTVADADAVFNAWTSDPEVARYMRWSVHASVKDTVEWLSLEEENASKDTLYTWGFVLKETGELFGSGGLYYKESHAAYELGYNLAKKSWGHGLATEAARAILNFAVQTLDVHTFYGCHAKDNPASGKVMTNLGFLYQQDSEYSSFDGTRVFECREYALKI